MRSHLHRRQLLRFHQRDQDAVRRVADNAARTVCANIDRVPLKAWLERKGSVKDLGAVLWHHLQAFAPVLGDAALTAWLKGRYRSVLDLAQHQRETRKLSLDRFGDAIAAYARKMNLPAAQVKTLKEKYGRDAYEILRNADDVLEEKLEEAVKDIIESGVHVRGGISRLAEAFEAAGITAEKPWLLETLTRTEVQKAYRAGAWQADRDPVLREYLIGYEYVTAGDLRVRPTHDLMDGSRAPLDHPIWSLWNPETGFTGYNCRCGILKVYDDEEPDWNWPDPIPDPLATD